MPTSNAKQWQARTHGPLLGQGKDIGSEGKDIGPEGKDIGPEGKDIGPEGKDIGKEVGRVCAVDRRPLLLLSAQKCPPGQLRWILQPRRRITSKSGAGPPPPL